MTDAAQQTGQKPLKRELVLASTSPRRRELLSCLGIDFRVVPPSTLETMLPDETPREMVERLALSKAMSVAQSLSGGLVIGADSVVVLDGRVLGKPVNSAQAREMLRSLRSREHRVMTGLALVDTANQDTRVASESSLVTMRDYSDNQLEAYVASGEPMDKAGAYAVQDRVFRPAEQLEGCYTNVMGLPLCSLVNMIRDAGLEVRSGQYKQVTRECTQCPLKDVY
ncbi:MAG: septum formation protein Maf [Dehalococcoidia bacterium]|nr:septum formation protein Maf [Dehalococcoidia bacterium]